MSHKLRLISSTLIAPSCCTSSLLSLFAKSFVFNPTCRFENQPLKNDRCYLVWILEDVLSTFNNPLGHNIIMIISLEMSPAYFLHNELYSNTSAFGAKNILITKRQGWGWLLLQPSWLVRHNWQKITFLDLLPIKWFLAGIVSMPQLSLFLIHTVHTVPVF